MRPAGGIAGPLAALAVVLGATPGALAAPPPPPQISAPAAIVIDARTGEKLYGVNPDDPRAIASTTKLMTALLTLEKTKPQQVFAMPPYPISPAESQLGLRTGERMTVHDLMRAMMLP